MSRQQTTLMTALAAVLIALVAVITLVEPPEDRPEGEPEWVPLFADVQRDDIVALRLSDEAGAVALERGADGWRMTEPMAARADATRVEGALSALAEARRSDPFDRDDASVYGLDSPQVRVEATTADGRTLRLDLGDDAPAGSGSYLRDAEGRLAVSQTRLTASLAADPGLFRSREVVAFARSSVQRVGVEGPGVGFALARDPQGWWIERGGGTQRASDDAVAALLEALRGLRVQRFSDAPLALETSWTLHLTTQDETFTVQIGVGDGPTRAVSAPLLTLPELVAAGPLLTAVSSERLVSDALLPVRAATVDGVELRLGDVSLSASRGSDGWSPAAAEAALGVLPTLRADRSASAPAPDGEPWGEIALLEGEVRESRVRLYQPVGDRRVAQDAGGGDPFFVLTSELNRLASAAQ